MSQQPVCATVSGSFRRSMGAVQAAVYRLTDAGVRVLSPADPRVVDHFGDFLFVASDRVRSIKLVQSRHLAAISASDFLWLEAPDGYIGQSGAMELGYAIARGVPVFCSEVPGDLTLRQYVKVTGAPEEAAQKARRRPTQGDRSAYDSVLLDPLRVVHDAHDDLDVIAKELSGPTKHNHVASDAAARLDLRVARPLRAR